MATLKISWFVKEVIILDVYIIVIFTPYYDPSPPPWKVVANSISSCLYYHHYQKRFIFVSVSSLLYDSTYLQWLEHQGHPMVCLSNQVFTGLLGIYNIMEVLT